MPCPLCRRRITYIAKPREVHEIHNSFKRLRLNEQIAHTIEVRKLRALVYAHLRAYAYDTVPLLGRGEGGSWYIEELVIAGNDGTDDGDDGADSGEYPRILMP